MVTDALFAYNLLGTYNEPWLEQEILTNVTIFDKFDNDWNFDNFYNCDNVLKFLTNIGNFLKLDNIDNLKKQFTFYLFNIDNFYNCDNVENFQNLLTNPCEHVDISDNWEPQFMTIIVTSIPISI